MMMVVGEGSRRVGGVLWEERGWRWEGVVWWREGRVGRSEGGGGRGVRGGVVWRGRCGEEGARVRQGVRGEGL